MSGGVFSPRSEISRATDVNDESGAISSRSLTRRQRSPRTPRSGIGRERLKLKALAKFESSRRKPGEIRGSWRNKTVEKLDNDQSTRVMEAINRQKKSELNLNSSIQLAQRSKMTRFPELLPEMEQYKFFHDSPIDLSDKKSEEKRKETDTEIRIDDDELFLMDDIFGHLLNMEFTVHSMSWSDRKLKEQDAKIYCIPGEEAELDPITDDINFIREANEYNGIYMGEEIILSDNLRAWLKRDGWLVNGVPYCLEEAIYPHPVRHWSLPFGNERPIKTKSPRVYPSELTTNSNDPNLVRLGNGDNNPHVISGDFELVILVKYYKFFNHPTLLTEEMLIEQELMKTYDIYVDANKKLSTSKYEKILEQYREAWKRKLGESRTFQGLPSSPSKISIAQLLQELIGIRKKRDLERKNVKIYFNKVVELWQRLEYARQTQGYVTSRSILKLYSIAPPDNDREIWEQDLENEIEELKHHHNNVVEQYEKEMRMRETSNNQDELTLADLETSLPQKPADWNEQLVRNEVIQLALDNRRNPTENIKTAILDIDGIGLTPIDQIHDSNDRSKIEALSKIKYFIKVYYNNVFVTQSDSLNLSDQLTVHDGNKYKIRTRNKPKSAKVEIYEVSGRFKAQKLISGIVLDIPSGDISENTQIERSITFPQRNNPSNTSPTGILVTALYWGTDADGKILSPKNYKSAITFDHRKRDMNDPQLHLYSEGEELIDDPNDPAYIGQSDVTSPQPEAFSGFVLNPFMSDGFFCSSEVLDKSKRLRFLQLRGQEVTEFVGRRMVPLKEHEIQENEFKEYEERMNQNYKNIPSEDRRALIRQERRRTKELVLQRLRAVSKTLSFSEVVIEDPIPEFGALLGNFSKFFEARRPLKPERKAVKRRVNETVKEPKIIISIRSAQNLPVRENKFDEESLKPFVTVSFMDEEERTSVAFGSSPSWNEQMELSWTFGISRMISGFQPLAKEEFIYINVFDEELIIQPGEDNVFTSHAMKNWIGGVTVPLSSLLSRGLVEGQLHLQVPPLLFGYHKENKITPTIDVYISIDASCPQVDHSHQFPTNEKADEAQAADDLILNLRKKFPDREYYSLVADMKGETWFVTRYISALNIPEELESQNLTRENMAHRLLRYVSLIPYEADSVNFSGSYDLWGTNSDFLTCLIGDDEEHAVLLISYFLRIEMTCPKLLFGYSIDNGNLCWVTTLDEVGQVQLWDPLNGTSYRPNDPRCPLTAVYCAADQANVYYNIQNDVRPNRISWNFDSWQKLWPSPPISPHKTIQIENFQYDPINTNAALREASQIERFIKERIRSWRLGQLTRFRSDISQTMKQVLSQCEFLSMENAPIDKYLTDPITQKFSNSKIVGYPLHIKAQDQSGIEGVVKSVGIHKSNRSNVEFGIAVHIQPYPGNIQSLWIYLAQITPL